MEYSLHLLYVWNVSCGKVGGGRGGSDVLLGTWFLTYVFCGGGGGGFYIFCFVFGLFAGYREKIKTAYGSVPALLECARSKGQTYYSMRCHECATSPPPILPPLAPEMRDKYCPTAKACSTRQYVRPPPPLPTPLSPEPITARASLLVQAASTHGDPYDERPVNENGTRGEYAVVRYHSVIFTPLMFLICGVLLFWEFHLNDWSAESLAENPSFGPSVETLIEAGAKRTDLIVDDGDWWRIISREIFYGGVCIEERHVFNLEN